MGTAPRTFKVKRLTDVSGVSGEGHVADGVVFEDGTTVLRWRTAHSSTAIYNSFEEMKKIHGHGGATGFEFDEGPVKVEVNFGGPFLNAREFAANLDREVQAWARRRGGGLL